MKIKQLKLKNFAQFEDFEIVFNDGITNLVGINGAGKTTVGLTALWAGFKGIAEKSKTGALIGQRFRFITEGKKSLDVEITLRDEKTQQDIVLKRHITKGTNTIKITPEKGGEITREYVENLFNVSFLSANHFSALTGKEQAAAMGIDTASFDKNLKKRKEHAQEYRRDIKKIGDLTPVEECTKKDIEELYKRQKGAIEHNAEQTRLTAQLSTWRDKIEDIDEDISHAIDDFEVLKAAHEQKIADLNEERINASTTVEEFPPINDPIDLEPIEAEIKTIVDSNQKFYAYETYKTKLAEKEELEGYLNDNLLLQKDIAVDRRNYLQSKSFGIKGLEVNGDGELTKDGKLIRPPYFSKGELEVLVARIGMNLNPELKVRFIDNFELLDDDNQEKLIKHLTRKGFQIITATVGKKIVDNHSVLLRECKVVGGQPVASVAEAIDADIDNDEWDEPRETESRVNIKDLEKTDFDYGEDEPTIYSNDPEDCEDRTPGQVVSDNKGQTDYESGKGSIQIPAPEAVNSADDYDEPVDNDDDDEF